MEPQKSQRWLTCVGVKDGNGLATLAFDGDFFGLPAALPIGNAAQGGDQIVFDDDLRPVAVSSAWAGETVPQNGQTSAFLAGFHCDFAAAGGAGEFFLGGGVGHGELRIADCGLRILNRRQRRGEEGSLPSLSSFASVHSFSCGLRTSVGGCGRMGLGSKVETVSFFQSSDNSWTKNFTDNRDKETTRIIPSATGNKQSSQKLSISQSVGCREDQGSNTLSDMKCGR